MRTLLLAAGLLAAFPLASTVTAPASAAKVGSAWVEGTLVHVSTDNIKVKDDNTGKVLGFVIVPRFGAVFKSDGSTPVDMKTLHSGQLVKVYYDQKLLGARHADRILVLNRREMPVKMQKG